MEPCLCGDPYCKRCFPYRPDPCPKHEDKECDCAENAKLEKADRDYDHWRDERGEYE